MKILELFINSGAKGWLTRRLVGAISAGLAWLSGLAVFADVTVPNASWVDTLATFVVSLATSGALLLASWISTKLEK